MNFDEPTLLTVLGLASLTAGAMFATLYRVARQMPGVLLWAIGCCCIGLATMVDGPRLIEDWRVASLLFNIPVAVGQVCILAGTMQFCGRPGAMRALWLLSAIVVVVTIVFTLLVPDTAWRIGALSTHQTVVNAWTAWILWTSQEKLARRVFQVAAATVALQACAGLVQGILIVGSAAPVSYGAPQLPLANLVSAAGAILNTLIGNWALFLLIMLRLVGEVRAMAGRDALTGLLNRRGLRQHLDPLLARGPDGGQTLGVLLLDIDYFKAINDTHGHEMGDKVLVVMGQVLASVKLPNAAACRWGGEEFCIVLDNPAPAAALALAERVRAHFHRNSASIDGLGDGASVSAGLAIMPQQPGFEMAALIARADSALYRAKESGRDRVCQATPAPACALA
ncbi:diguanylate cyclase [Massilia sp. CF038]|uniref:GGDEF domain-containing protein n=1 Tax=Massilia sp. CF038 TaxID=1881045 RepID=UPI000921A1BD|nr:GGDEF domain-containing protein [Massilia sp. CF038]SHG62573.1 diguanylate cyclase (GGDEF) domain-containing protein [Massilia sp. CF038]